MCDHGHGHGGGGCASEITEVLHADEGIEYNLDSMIDKEKVQVLNESVEGHGVRVFKPFRERLDKTFYVESDVDEELLFNIPFTGHVKITGITLIGDMDESFPSRIRIFKDREQMSFSDVEGAKPDQEMQLKMDDAGKIDYPLIVTKFGDVHHLTLYFPSNFGNDTTKIYYIGLRGQFNHSFRERIAIATYEARPMPDDHKHSIPETNHSHVC
uniref:PITH domain-containing protein n=1 Tax=Panagrellus redivivus TaxID=6233 RepID=A0A7E4W489_PANRE